MKKILFACEHLPNEGGIGSALINQLSSVDQSKYEVTLCVVGNYIDPNVKIPSGTRLIKGSKLMEYHIVNYAKRKAEYRLIERVAMLSMKQVRRRIGFEKYQEFALKHYHLKESFDVAISYSNDICKNGIPISGGSNYFVKHCVQAKRKIAWIHNEVEKQGFTHTYCLKNFRDYDCIVNVSLGCKELFDEMTPEYKDKSKFVYNSVDTSRIDRLLLEDDPHDMEASDFTILTVGRMEEGQKRISRIIECVGKLKQNGYNCFHWYVLGDGPDLASYVAQTKEHQLDNILKFLGRKNNPFIYMRNADVFVLPSLYESFGMVLKESLYTGCPTIACDFRACKEIIEDGITGIICKNSTDGIYEAVCSVLEDSNRLSSLHMNCLRDSESLNQTAMQQFEAVVEGLY